MNKRFSSHDLLNSVVTVLADLTLILLVASPILLGVADCLSESDRFVHNYVGMPPYGNWTFVEKPVYPIYFNHSEIPIGSNWTVFCPLSVNRSYHVYCYGEWTDHDSDSSTDYDLYVYNPIGELEEYRTESTGLPEHLGGTSFDPYFTPRYSGNYSFVIRNDPRESNGSLPVTLMIMENVACNKWHETFIQGKEGDHPVLNTCWAYEFVTEDSDVEVWINAPTTLDLFEVRLYLMANMEANIGESLGGVPLAWEPGLYGELGGDGLGGYNLESEGYRGVAYASCEFFGQDMFLNYSSPFSGVSLYHLVLIGEAGSGTVEFIINKEYEEKKTETERYVHTSLNSPTFGNWTLMDKPMFPIFWNESMVGVGENWTVVCPLVANHSYHIYCYGDWIDLGSEPDTDYDIYVYDPTQRLVGYHTESAGLPEHLGTEADDPLFVPSQSGNYTFVLVNDVKESHGSRQATFMIIEDVKCNTWNEHYVNGKIGEMPVLETSWGYEFVSESQNIELTIKVPDTLDMYEARLYLMAISEDDMWQDLNLFPLAWEPGLYGELGGDGLGGYNLESEGYRGVAYASCEFFGQDMFLNYSSPFSGVSLYHLVLIGEAGSGTVQFAVRTNLEDLGLNPLVIPKNVYSNNDTLIAYVSNVTDLKNATLHYSISKDVQGNTSSLSMEIFEAKTCRVIVPGQDAGSFVNYVVEATDELDNSLVATGNYSVKHLTSLNISLTQEAIHVGGNITVKGYLTPQDDNVPVTVSFISTNKTERVTCYTIANGSFIGSFRPQTLGVWRVRAELVEDEFRYGSISAELSAHVEEPPLWLKYQYYIGGGLGAVAVLGVVVYLKKFRE